ncbi:MAG: hemolysin family protein, partial [Gemmatimonadota bacterium]
MLGTIALFASLLFLSAFFSGSEIALFSLSEARVRMLVEEGHHGAEALLRLKKDPERLLVTILVGNNVANVGAASVATYLATQALGSAGVGVATGAVTLLLLFFGEITPKGLAAAEATRISLFAAPILSFLSRAFFFVITPMSAITRAVMPREIGGEQEITEGEIRTMTRMGHVSGDIDEHEREIIERAFLLDSTQAWEVMTPRVEIFAWPDEAPLFTITDELRTVPYSRIPVYGEGLDDVTGVLYLRDAYQALIGGRDDIPLGELALDPLFVPGSVSLVELLRDFQSLRVHLGIVVDEYGGTDGLVTLEDVLEELVGEIHDEVDVPEEEIVRRSRNEIVVDGSADLRAINHFFNTSFPLLEHRSLNGYLLDDLGRVPRPEETFEREGVRIEVLDATDTQVTRARLERLPGRGRSGGVGPPRSPGAGGEGGHGAEEEDRREGDEDDGGRGVG